MSLATGRVRFGAFELDLRAGELRENGVKIRLQEQPLQVLAILLEHPGEVVTREEIQKRLWPSDTFVDFEHSLNAAIKRLRDGLSDSATQPRYIETLPRHGYRFIAPVEGVALNPARGDAANSTSGDQSSSPQERPAHRPGVRQARMFVVSVVVAGAAVASMLLVLDVGGLRGRALRAAGVAREQTPNVRSIAVLPLDNLSGDPEQDYFAEGMTEALITDLAQVRALSVRSRNSVMAYKDHRKPTPAVARELNVDAILEGAVLRAGDRVRITIQLIEGRTDRHLWARTYERDLHDVLALQGELARAVASEVKVELTSQDRVRLASGRRIDPEVYDAYLRGRYYFNRYSPEASLKAIEYLQLATEKDPGFAPAFAALSPAYGQRAYWGFTRPGEVAPQAWAAARRAVEIDDTSAEAHCWLGASLAWAGWDWSGGERELERAIELNPNLADAHQTYAMLLGSLDRHDEAMAEVEKALELDPFNLTNHGIRGFLLYTARREREAVTTFRRTLEMGPEHIPARWDLWKALGRLGMYEGALEECARVFSSMGNREVAAALGTGTSAQEYRAAMFRAAQRLAAQSSQRYVAPIDIALLYTQAGEQEEALTWLERAYDERTPRLHTIWVDPAWDGLRSAPRFRDLVRRMNFPG